MKEQGESAELEFMMESHSRGHIVSIPFGDSAKYDVVVDTGTNLYRVQVKSTLHQEINRGSVRKAYRPSLCCGSKSKQRYAATEIDLFAISIIELKVWYIIPVEEVTSLRVSLYPHRKVCVPGAGRYEKYLNAWHLFL